MTAQDPPKLARAPYGLTCPSCKQSAGDVERIEPHAVLFWCRACGHRWFAERPGSWKY